MAAPLRHPLITAAAAVVLVILTGCGGTSELTLETDIPVVETAPPPEAPAPLIFMPPTSCADLLPPAFIEEFASEGIALLRGPGSPSAEPKASACVIATPRQRYGAGTLAVGGPTDGYY